VDTIDFKLTKNLLDKRHNQQYDIKKLKKLYTLQIHIQAVTIN
jgi:hypothetical protein